MGKAMNDGAGRIDAHQHYWRFNPVRDAWITENMAPLRRDFLPADVASEMLASAIDGAVAVQADQSETETQFLLDLAATHPFVRGVVGWIDLRAPTLVDRLALWRGDRALKGFRHIAQAEPDDFLDRYDVARGIRTVGEHGFSYDILIYPRQFDAAVRLVGRCPGVRFILDHCGKPAIARGEIAEWRAGLERLAHFPNVYCKLSGLVTEAKWTTWKPADLVPYLDVAAAAFEPSRLMFGSDWPVCLVASGYNSVVAIIEQWTERMNTAERARIFGGTAREAYRLESRDGS
jgi:L-fuconolactonase